MTTPPIILTAPPRSGTSCIAGMLHAAGIDMGEEGFEPPDPERNPPGDFEDARLRDPSFRVATALLRAERVPHMAVDQFHDALESRRDDAARRPWGWKDPYLCVSGKYLLGGADALWILVDRPREETVASLRACGSTERWIIDTLPLFYAGMDGIESEAEHCRRVPYPDVVAKPHLWATTILGWVTVRTMYGFTHEEMQVAAGHVDPGLRHHVVCSEQDVAR